MSVRWLDSGDGLAEVGDRACSTCGRLFFHADDCADPNESLLGTAGVLANDPQADGLRSGDAFWVRPAWGSGAPVEVLCDAVALTSGPRERYGWEVDVLGWDELRAGLGVVDYSIAPGETRWAYGGQCYRTEAEALAGTAI